MTHSVSTSLAPFCLRLQVSIQQSDWLHAWYNTLALVHYEFEVNFVMGLKTRN